jgi:hypothetical protein
MKSWKLEEQEVQESSLWVYLGWHICKIIKAETYSCILSKRSQAKANRIRANVRFCQLNTVFTQCSITFPTNISLLYMW